MGLLMAALGGAADQGIDSINKQQAIDAQSALVQQSSDLALQREKAIEEFKTQNADAMRQTKVGLINTQLATNADNSVAGKFDTTALPDTEVNSDGTPGSTPMPDEAKQNYADAQATLAAAKDGAVQKFSSDPMNLLRASVETGYNGAQDLANVTSKQDMAQLRYENQAQMNKLSNDTKIAVKDATISGLQAKYTAEIAAGKFQRSTAGGGDPSTTVQRTIQNADGGYVAVMKDGSTQDLNVNSGALNKNAAALAEKLAGSDFTFAKLPVANRLAQAKNLLLSGTVAQSTNPAPKSLTFDPKTGTFH